MVAAIVLAAGKSERMGRPKALLPIAGHTFLEHILHAIDDSSIEYTVVVVGHQRENITSVVKLDHAIFNPDYECGMITSIQSGIRELPSDCRGAFLFLVDHPVVDAATIEILIANFKSGHIILPTYQGRRGHPVLFSREILEEILALPITGAANSIVHKDPARVIEVAVDNPGVTIDVDTPEQFAEFQRSYSS